MKVDPRMPGTGPPAIEPPGLLSELQPRAIAVGVAVDLIATLVTNAVLMVVLATRQGHAASEIPPEVIEEVMLSPEGLLAGFVVGSLCTVLGGYVAGRRAGRHGLRHGVAVGVVMLLISGVFMVLPGQPQPPIVYQLVGLVAIVPLAALGGRWAELGWPALSR